MSDIVTRNLIGTIDGVNQDFTTPEPYMAGSVALWVNGLLRVDNYDDGFEELGVNQIRLRTAPLPGTVLQVQYRPV